MSSTPCPNIACVSEEDYYNGNWTPPGETITIDIYLSEMLTRISFAFEVISVVLIMIVVALSAVQTTAKTSSGPKIFAVNLLGFNLLYCLSSLLSDMRSLPYVYDMSIFGNTVVKYLMDTDCIRSLTLLVFNASYVPFLAMFIVACLRPHRFNTKSASIYYAGLVILSDVVPIAIQMINLLNLPSIMAFGINSSWSTDLYAYSIFTMYVLQVSLMVVSVWVVTLKSKQLTVLQSNPAQTAARRKELVKALYFAVGPCLIQLPIAIQLALIQVEKTLQVSGDPAYYRFAELMFPINNWVRMSRSITPIVDALSIVMFLGEYRRSAIRMLRYVGRLVGDCFYRSNNSVEQLPPYEAARYPSVPWQLAATSSATPYYTQSQVSYIPRHAPVS